MNMDKKFSYGNKRVKFNNNNIYVEPVDNLHDLTLFEKSLDDVGTSWAVYVIQTSEGCKFALIAQGRF